jgi:hypothetical protein
VGLHPQIELCVFMLDMTSENSLFFKYGTNSLNEISLSSRKSLKRSETHKGYEFRYDQTHWSHQVLAIHDKPFSDISCTTIIENT